MKVRVSENQLKLLKVNERREFMKEIEWIERDLEIGRGVIFSDLGFIQKDGFQEQRRVRGHHESGS